MGRTDHYKALTIIAACCLVILVFGIIILGWDQSLHYDPCNTYAATAGQIVDCMAERTATPK